MYFVARARVLVAALGVGALVFACAQGAEPTTDPNAGVDTSQSGTDPAPSASASSTSSQPSTPPQTTADASAGTDDTARAPAITSIAPNKAPVGSVGPTIVVTGNDFVARTVVQLDGAPLATTFVSATELRATIPTTSLANVGTLMVSAGTSPPGGGASKELTFSVENPAPTLTQLSPLSAVAGSPPSPRKARC
jgi:cytoskeletal protein RodZ